MAEGFEGLLEAVTADLRDRAGSVPGALVESKASSVAVHYRLVDEADRPRIKAIVDELLTRHAGELKVTPGKMVYELQPNLDWDKGKAVMHLLEALGLDGDDVVPLYIGDDITDEDAFADARRSRDRHPRRRSRRSRGRRPQRRAPSSRPRTRGEVRDLLDALAATRAREGARASCMAASTPATRACGKR